MFKGHTEVTTTREPDDEESFNDLHLHHHLLLSLLRVLRLCCLRRWHARKPLDRVRLLRTILAYRFRQRLYCPPSSGRLSGESFYLPLYACNNDNIWQWSFWIWFVRSTASQCSPLQTDGLQGSFLTADLSTSSTWSSCHSYHHTDWIYSGCALEQLMSQLPQGLPWSFPTSTRSWECWDPSTSGPWPSTSPWRCTLRRRR